MNSIISNHGIGIYAFNGNYGYNDLKDFVTDYANWYIGIFVSQLDTSSFGFICTSQHVYYFYKATTNFTIRIKIQ